MEHGGRLSRSLNEIMHAKHLAQFLTHNTGLPLAGAILSVVTFVMNRLEVPQG